MSDEELCGEPTQGGAPCRWKRSKCPHHQGGNEPAASPIPATRDLHELGWWLVENIAERRLNPAQGSVIASAMRVLYTLGPADTTGEDPSRVIELQARLAQGFAPRDDDEWALASRLFDDAALAEFRRLPALDEVNGSDRRSHLGGLQRSPDEPEVPGFPRDED